MERCANTDALNAYQNQLEVAENAQEAWEEHYAGDFETLAEMKKKLDEAYANWNGDTEDCKEYQEIENIFSDIQDTLDAIDSDFIDGFDFSEVKRELAKEALTDDYYN